MNHTLLILIFLCLLLIILFLFIFLRLRNSRENLNAVNRYECDQPGNDAAGEGYVTMIDREQCRISDTCILKYSVNLNEYVTLGYIYIITQYIKNKL